MDKLWRNSTRSQLTTNPKQRTPNQRKRRKTFQTEKLGVGNLIFSCHVWATPSDWATCGDFLICAGKTAEVSPRCYVWMYVCFVLLCTAPLGAFIYFCDSRCFLDSLFFDAYFRGSPSVFSWMRTWTVHIHWRPWGLETSSNVQRYMISVQHLSFLSAPILTAETNATWFLEVCQDGVVWDRQYMQNWMSRFKRMGCVL